MKTKFVLLSFALTACASAQKTPAIADSKPQPQVYSEQQSGNEIRVDIDGLKRSLGLDRSRMDLGYQEKRFNSCSAGFGFPRENCKDQVFVSINFRLQCRDTTGTTSEVVTSAQLDPIANKKVQWQIGKSQASVHTDDEGYGQLNGIFAQSSAPKAQRLRLAVGSQFVYVRAGEVTRIVTPSNWCPKN